MPSDYTTGVMVDGQVYPLEVQRESSLYFSGEAPAAMNGYSYAILNNQNAVIETENFMRSPVIDGETYNEYYNRSWNYMDLAQLPAVLEPLPIINRIDSDLHIDGQIPTIHITGDESAIYDIHSTPLQKKDIDVRMTYIR